MRLNYFVRRKARLDIDDAREWYESQQVGRGDEFVVELHDRINDLRDHPRVSCLVSKRVRAVRMKRSKFIIYFTLENDSVIILTVQHERAHPNRRRGRT